MNDVEFVGGPVSVCFVGCGVCVKELSVHSVKLSVDERDSVRSVGGMTESCAVLLLCIESGLLMRAG